MTDFTPGAIITRDNPLWDGDRHDPPSWLRGDVTFEPRIGGSIWAHQRKMESSWTNWIDITAIRLDASDIVYQCIAWNEEHPDEPVMWPWYGGDEAPSDWDGGDVLLRDGVTLQTKNAFDRWISCSTGADIIGYQRRPTTSLPEPAEEEARRESARIGAWVHRRMKEAATRGLAHTSGYAETIEESPEDFARAACKRAGMVAVKRMTESEAKICWRKMAGSMAGFSLFKAWLTDACIIRPDRTPLDIAKAEHPDIPAEIVERIAAIVKGEANV